MDINTHLFLFWCSVAVLLLLLSGCCSRAPDGMDHTVTIYYGEKAMCVVLDEQEPISFYYDLIEGTVTRATKPKDTNELDQ